MIKKCQKDFSDSLKDQIDYALFRTKNKMLKYLKLRIHFDADSFVSLNDVLKYFTV